MKGVRLKYMLLVGAAAVSAQARAQSLDGQASSATAAVAGPQSNDQAQTSTASPPTGGGVGDIIVTARRRSENLRDVPVAITAVSGAALTEAKITQVVDLGQRIPNFTVSSGANLPFSLIRGFGSGNDLSFDQAVGKFIDNVSYGRDQDIRLPLFDVERVEVLKGPQVLLYGNSATAGALNITTKKPGKDFAADGSVAYDFNYNEVVTQVGVTTPISQDVSLRVAGLYQDQSRGLTYNTLTDRQEPAIRNYAGRATLRATPSSALTITLKAEYDNLRELGFGGELSSEPVFLPISFPDATLDSRTTVNNDAAPFDQKAFNIVTNQTYQGDIEYQLGPGTLSSTTAYRDLKFGESTPSPAPIPILNAFLAYRYKQFSQELRYGAKLGRVDLTVGGYYQHDTFNVASAIDFNLSPTLPPGFVVPPFAVDGTLDQKSNSYSLFGDLTYHFSDELSLEVGGRYSWIRKSADQALNPGNIVTDKTFDTQGGAISINPALTPLFFLGEGVAPHSYTGLKLREGFFQPQAVLQYKLNSKDQIYFKYVRGEKAGGFDYFYAGSPPGPTPQGAQFAPEKASSLEVGFKGLAFDNKLEFALSAFRTTFTDLQAASFVVSSFVVTNVGKARTQGGEIELTFVPITGLRIGASGAYLDAKYLDYPGQPCTVAQDIANGGTTGCTQDLSHTPTQFSSKWSGTFSVDYEQPVSDRFILGGGVAVFARSRYNASTNNEPLQEQGGYAQVDLHLDLKPSSRHWSISFFSRNVTDKKVLTFGAKAPGLGDALTGYLSRGRQLGARFGFNF